MSITSTYMYKVEHDLEQYSFPSNVNPRQRHFVESAEGQWQLNVVQTEESLSLEELQELRVELAELYAFMVTLNQREIRRQTEPGEPEQHGIGGGL